MFQFLFRLGWLLNTQKKAREQRLCVGSKWTIHKEILMQSWIKTEPMHPARLPRNLSDFSCIPSTIYVQGVPLSHTKCGFLNASTVAIRLQVWSWGFASPRATSLPMKIHEDPTLSTCSKIKGTVRQLPKQIILLGHEVSRKFTAGCPVFQPSFGTQQHQRVRVSECVYACARWFQKKLNYLA